jgi:hypothetical protein
MKQLLSIGTLIDRSWDVYRSHLKTWMKIVLWFLVPSFVYIVGVLLAPAESNLALVELRGLTPLEDAGVFIKDTLTQIVILFVTAWVTLQTIKALQLFEKQQFSLKEVQRYAFKRSGGFIVLTILRYVLIGLPAVLILPGFGLNLLGIQAGNGLLSLFGVLVMLIGIILSIIGIVYVAVQVNFVSTAFVLEELSFWRAFKRSRELVKGQFWPILFRLVVPKLIFTSVSVVFSLILVALTGLLFVIIPFTSEPLLLKSAFAANSLISALPLALIVPLLASVDFQLFQTLKQPN